MNEELSQARPSFLGHLIEKAVGRADPVLPRSSSIFGSSRPLRDPLADTAEIATTRREDDRTERHVGMSVHSSLRNAKEDRSIAANEKSESEASLPVAGDDDVRRGVAKMSGGTEAVERAEATRLPAAPATESSPVHRSNLGSVGKSFLQIEDERAVFRSDPQEAAVLKPRSGKDSRQQQDQLSPDKMFSLWDFSPKRNQPHETADNREGLSGLPRRVPVSRSELVDSDMNLIDAREGQPQTSPSSDFFEYQLFRGLMVPKASPIVRTPSPSIRPPDDGKMFPTIHAARTDPVVNVTIGRIEVRAVPAHATVPQRRSEIAGTKPMTLKEYLNNRGGRR